MSLSLSPPSTSPSPPMLISGGVCNLPRQADDFHLHLRDEPYIADSLTHLLSKGIARGIVMPNLNPPVTTTQLALEYRQRILTCVAKLQQKLNLPPERTFHPLMTLYLTDSTTVEEIRAAKASGHIYACKMYPKGATTHSKFGVSHIPTLYPVFQVMAECGILLLIHGEAVEENVDIFDRERSFLTTHLQPIIDAVPNLKIVLEHVTTKEAVDFILSAPPNVGATITAHHLLYNRNALLAQGLNPHFYCMPLLKTETDRQALLQAAAYSSKFFAGTDSAPHARHNKEQKGSCAGIFTAFAAVELYAEAFAHINALDLLPAFVSENGARFYGLPLNPDQPLKLVQQPWRVPDTLPFGPDQVVPLRAGETIQWRLEFEEVIEKREEETEEQQQV